MCRGCSPGHGRRRHWQRRRWVPQGRRRLYSTHGGPGGPKRHEPLQGLAHCQRRWLAQKLQCSGYIPTQYPTVGIPGASNDQARHDLQDKRGRLGRCRQAVQIRRRALARRRPANYFYPHLGCCRACTLQCGRDHGRPRRGRLHQQRHWRERQPLRRSNVGGRRGRPMPGRQAA